MEIIPYSVEISPETFSEFKENIFSLDKFIPAKGINLSIFLNNVQNEINEYTEYSGLLNGGTLSPARGGVAVSNFTINSDPRFYWS